jgi:hypothetical protein
MTLNGRSGLVILAAMTTLALGCGNSDNRHTGKHDVWFMGAVIDGATGNLITTYDISLVSGTTTLTGKVDAQGRYMLGPLQAWNDYGVLINSAGYRAFSSYNAGIAPPSVAATSVASDIYSSDTSQTFNFDASLFPTAIVPPDVSIGVIETGPVPHAASGHIRLQPTSQSAIQAQPSEVGNQSWSNDADLYAGAISADFSNGSFAATGAMLTYGVTYAVTIYGVDGYQPSAPVNVQAGVNTGASILINPLTVPPLQLVANTIPACHAPAMLTDTSSAVVTLTFNENVEDGTLTAGAGAEALDNSLGFTDTLFTSQLTLNASSTVQEHGTSLTIASNVVTLSWNPNVGLGTKGTGDAIRTVTYSSSSLGLLYLQPTMHPELRVSLSQLLTPLMSFGTITCSAP